VLQDTKSNIFFKEVSYGLAKTAFLIWILIIIGTHFGWVGFDYWSSYSPYFIIVFFLSLLIGLAIEKSIKDNFSYKKELAGTLFFLILWLITQITDIFGRYEYPEYFLGFAFLFFLGFIIYYKEKPTITSLSPLYRSRRILYKIAIATLAIWIFIKIGTHFNWVGLDYWSYYSQYFITTFFLLFFIGFLSEESVENTTDALFSFGIIGIIIGIVLWGLAKLIRFIPDYHTHIFTISIIIIGLSYVFSSFQKKEKKSFTEDIERRMKSGEDYLKEKMTKEKYNQKIKNLKFSHKKKSSQYPYTHTIEELDAHLKWGIVTKDEYFQIKKDLGLIPKNGILKRLDERFKNGEISKDEYLQKKRDLEA